MLTVADPIFFPIMVANFGLFKVLDLDHAIRLIHGIWKSLSRFPSDVCYWFGFLFVLDFGIKATWLTSHSFSAVLVQSILAPACVFNFATGSHKFLRPFEYLE